VGIKERRGKEKQLLEDKILDAARNILAEEGYEGLSMRRIAERIEYSATTIYLYFKDKSELVYALSEETYGHIYNFKKIGDCKKDPLKWLRKAMRLYLEFGLDNPSHYKAAYIAHPYRHPEMIEYDEWHPNAQRGLRAYSEAISECVKQGEFRPVDVALTNQVLGSALHGLVSAMVTHHDFPWLDRDRLIEHLIETIIFGLASPGILPKA